MTNRKRGAKIGEGAVAGRDGSHHCAHPILNRETGPDIDGTNAYEIDSDLKDFLQEDIVVDQLKRVDKVYEIPPQQTNAILDAILEENGPVALGTLTDNISTGTHGSVEEAIFVLENRNLIETRSIRGEEHVAFHHGGLEAVRRARYRDRLTVRMVEDKMDRQPQDDPLVA